MQSDYSKRGAGKTTRMIEWLAEKPDRILLVFANREVERLSSLYPELSGRIFHWAAYQQNYMHGSPMHEVSIDNADLILQEQFRQKISKISISDETDSRSIG
jgi:hypothetical protein